MATDKRDWISIKSNIKKAGYQIKRESDISKTGVDGEQIIWKWQQLQKQIIWIFIGLKRIKHCGQILCSAAMM